ncbi:MAG: hypothetical protein ACD_65C00160G0001, partial [uncultured bacterium]
AFDPVAMENAKKLFKKDTVNFCDTPHKAAKGADALLILTEWDEFRAVDLKKIKELMRGSLICDGRNIYNPAEVKKIGFKYKSIGR